MRTMRGVCVCVCGALYEVHAGVYSWLGHVPV